MNRRSPAHLSYTSRLTLTNLRLDIGSYVPVTRGDLESQSCWTSAITNLVTR